MGLFNPESVWWKNLFWSAGVKIKLFHFKVATPFAVMASFNPAFLLFWTFKNHRAVFRSLSVFVTSTWPAWGPYPLCVAVAARLEKIKAINQLRSTRPLIFDRKFVIIWKILGNHSNQSRGKQFAKTRTFFSSFNFIFKYKAT